MQQSYYITAVSLNTFKVKSLLLFLDSITNSYIIKTIKIIRVITTIVVVYIAIIS